MPTVLHDLDQAMAQSAVARHLDNRAAHLLPLPDQQFEDWVRVMTPEISDLDFLTLLASTGKTRRVRAAASRPLHPQDRQPGDLIRRSWQFLLSSTMARMSPAVTHTSPPWTQHCGVHRNAATTGGCLTYH